MEPVNVMFTGFCYAFMSCGGLTQTLLFYTQSQTDIVRNL